MSYIFRRKAIQAGVVGLANFVFGSPLNQAMQAETRRGIFEFCNYMTGYKYDTPEWSQVMKLATKLNVVIQIHTNVREMQYLADNFPDATIVFPHLGGTRDDIFTRIAIVASHKNAHIDL